MGKVEDEKDPGDSNKRGIADRQRILLLQDTQLVTVNVGSSEAAESWTIHKRLLAHHSPYFAAAFNGNFTESATNTVCFVEDDPDAFKLFVQWLYSGELVRDLGDEDDLPNILCLAWALGDKLQCPVFQDRVMLKFVAYHNIYWMREDTMRLIYDISPPGSVLRAFAVDLLCWERLMDGPANIGVAAIMAVEDLIKDLLECEESFDRGEDPHEMWGCYLKVLDYEKCTLG
ncbi:MAG: hypothetical protein Q9198_007832 [Flavoplaca austrocitrina]